MSDLVGNPEDRFSHNEAHFVVCFLGALRVKLPKHMEDMTNEPRCEKTGLRPGRTQTGLYSNRRWLDA